MRGCVTHGSEICLLKETTNSSGCGYRWLRLLLLLQLRPWLQKKY
eukprot:SAG11_NODE_2315_length_3533_cov_1.847991_3_plen_45_part_00